MGRLFSRGALSLMLTLACAGGAIVVSCAADATERVPPVGGANVVSAAVAPAYREFESKCAAKTATRGDLIALKKFIAASAIDAAAKTNLTRQVRKMYQASKKKGKVEVGCGG